VVVKKMAVKIKIGPSDGFKQIGKRSRDKRVGATDSWPGWSEA